MEALCKGLVGFVDLVQLFSEQGVHFGQTGAPVVQTKFQNEELSASLALPLPKV